MKKIKNEIKELIPKKTETRLFLLSFFFLLFITILVTYNHEMNKCVNLLFDSDTSRVIEDATEIIAKHYRLSVHPLFTLFTQPFVFVIKGIVLNKFIAISILSALVSALSVLYIYKILDTIKTDPKGNIIISLIYLFSFSNMIFTSGIETYNFAALFLIMMWYYFVKKKEKYDIYSYIILILFGILSFAFTITNGLVFLILLFVLIISKKVKVKNLVAIGLITLVGVVSLSIFQKVIWNNTPLIWRVPIMGEGSYYSEKPSLLNAKNLILGDYLNPLISSDVYTQISYGSGYNGQNYVLNFKEENMFSKIVLGIFYVMTIVFVIRNFKKQKYLNIGLLLSLTYNSVFHFFYGNKSTFLYSLHFVYLIILLLGVNLATEDNKKFRKYGYLFCTFFALYEIINNNIVFVKCLKIIKNIIKNSYLLANLGFVKTALFELLMILIIVILIFGIIWLNKRIKREKKKELKIILGVGILCLCMGIQGIFIELESAPEYNRLFMIPLKGLSGDLIVKSKEDYLEKDFKSYFKEELKALNNYREEYAEFIENYNPQFSSSANWSNYYYFGLGNRKKYAYRTDKIIDIETKKEIIRFKEKEHMIIPNLYMVIIETTEGDFVRIYEDSEGVHYQINDKEKILEGTNDNINLYDFSNQKYPNIKKVLYGEILFNIKDSVIYPNIIVYNKPWYRDAAIASMVLKETNNLDLIQDWVSSITEIYDLQNAGIQEADNLGELLYIISTQENRNEELINKIEEEAERIASENEDGYYIKGKTDFGDMYLYQNLWYKLGIEALGKEYPFDLDAIPEDSYTQMTWWSDYEPQEKKPIESQAYPYLSYATRHKLGEGTITMNSDLYPLSWEIDASQANYDNYEGIDNEIKTGKISPLHTWAASELLLWILDETGDLHK